MKKKAFASSCTFFLGVFCNKYKVGKEKGGGLYGDSSCCLNEWVCIFGAWP